MVVLLVEEGGDGGFKLPVEEVVFEQDAVLQGLVPPFNLAPGLRMHRRVANVFHAFVFEVFGQIASEVGRPVVDQQAWFVQKPRAVAASCDRSSV